MDDPRQAQIHLLRKLAKEWAADELATSEDTVERETWWMAIHELQRLADDLERGDD
jgi:hypothetical protein